MNEHEFREAYQAFQQEILASEELKARTLAFVERSDVGRSVGKGGDSQLRHEGGLREGSLLAEGLCSRRSSGAGESRRACGTKGRSLQSVPRTVRGRTARWRWALPVAACFVAAALVAAGLPAPSLLGGMNSDAPLGLQEAAEASGFSVRAYASDGSCVINPGEGDLIVFDRMQSFDVSEGPAAQLGGVFTGCLFRVEGEGIARVQMNVSGGELYRQTVDHVVRADDPSLWEEATGWKETKRGLGSHYGMYDMVVVTAVSEVGVENDSLDALLMKRYGATVDVSAESDPGIASGETSFGLWADVGLLSGDEVADDVLESAVDAFDGEKLTVTVAFEDGRVSTQVIKLHVADFKRADSGCAPVVTPEKVSSEEVDSHAATLRSVYGEVISSDEQVFPCALGNANEYADVLMGTPALERIEYVNPAWISEKGEQREVTLADVELLDAGEQAEFSYFEMDEVEIAGAEVKTEGEHPITVGRVSIAGSILPPGGLVPSVFTSTQYQWLGDVIYFNKCTQERYGYRFNDDGSLSDEGYCYVQVSVALANSGNERVTVNGEQLGMLGFAGADGRLMLIDACYGVLDVRVAGDAQADGQDARYFTVQPGATAEVSLLYVVPCGLAASEELLFLASDGAGGIPAAFFLSD